MQMWCILQQPCKIHSSIWLRYLQILIFHRDGLGKILSWPLGDWQMTSAFWCTVMLLLTAGLLSKCASLEALVCRLTVFGFAFLLKNKLLKLASPSIVNTGDAAVIFKSTSWKICCQTSLLHPASSPFPSPFIFYIFTCYQPSRLSASHNAVKLILPTDWLY